MTERKKKKKLWLVFLVVGLFLFFAYAYVSFTVHKVKQRGYVMEIISTDGGPLKLRWTKVGYPALARWTIFSRKFFSINVLFYWVEIPRFALRSPVVPLPVKVRNRDILPVILVKKEWFPTLMKNLRPGEKFTVLVHMIIKREGTYFKITKKVKVLYTGSVFKTKGGKK